MPAIESFLGIIGIAAVGLAATYALVALIAVVAWQLRRLPKPSVSLPAVTVLKPLCGAEPGLYENLRSFCRQDYPEFQVVFGVRDRNDPALAVVERLIKEFPTLPIDVVIDSRQHGSNRKTSSLINMLGRARHDVLVMADSDAFARPDYLARVPAPLWDPGVGLVTCLYHAAPTQGIWSRLGAMYVNDWYMPSVLLARLFGHENYVSGQTLCLRRATLQAIGGLEKIASHLADDYQLGELVRGLGLRTVLSPYFLRAEHHEPTPKSLIRHELRWMRTIGVLRPRSFRFLFFTFTLPLALLGLLLAVQDSAYAAVAWPLLQFTIAVRLALHFLHRLGSDRPLLTDLWLLPIRDLLMGWIWFRSFFASRLTWRGSTFDVGADGIMRNKLL